jgi:hypothetical protein
MAALRPGHELTYADMVGLELNLPRVRLTQALALAQALSVANSNEPLTRDWADALSSSPDAVDDLLFQMNSARADAKARAKHGWGT